MAFLGWLFLPYTSLAWMYIFFHNGGRIEGGYLVLLILAGMGPVDPLKTDSAKLFATFYALYSGVAFLAIMAILTAPLLHRLLHKFHMEISEDERADQDDKPRK